MKEGREKEADDAIGDTAIYSGAVRSAQRVRWIRTVGTVHRGGDAHVHGAHRRENPSSDVEYNVEREEGLS